MANKPLYDPAALAAIHDARAELYANQAARRRRYLLTGLWTPQLNPQGLRVTPQAGKGPPNAMLVDQARADLNTARERARQSVAPNSDAEK